MPMSFDYIPPKIDARARLEAAIPLAVELGGKVLLEASLPLVPTETGTLKGSGKAELEGTHTVAVSYSATSRDGYAYGIRQHEDMSLHHPNGGEPKFLEKPMHSEAATILETMTVTLRTAL